MKKYVVMLLMIVLGFTAGCVPSKPEILMRFDGINKIPVEGGQYFTYVLLEKKGSLKWLPSFDGSEEEAIQKLLTPGQVESRSYSDSEQQIWMSLRNGTVVGHTTIDKQNGGIFKDATFLKVVNGKVIERIYSGDFKPVSKLMKPDGKFILDDDYESIMILDEQYIRVYKKGLYGIFNFKGESVLPVKYDYIGALKDGFIRVREKDKFGFADKNYRIVIKPQFQRAFDFVDGVAAIKQGNKWYLIDSNNQLINNAGFDLMGKYSSGKIIPVIIDRKKFNAWNFYNSESKQFYKFAARRFSVWEDLKYISLEDGKNTVLFGPDGNPVLPYAFEYIYPVNANRFMVTANGKKGVIDEKGKQVIPLQFSNINVNVNTSSVNGDYRNGIKILFKATPVDSNQSKILYDYWGKQLVPNKFDDYKHLTGDCILASTGLFSRKPYKAAIYKIGDTKPIFEADRIDHYNDGFLAYSKDKEWGIVDLKGNVIVEPDYTNIKYVGNNLFIAQDEDEYGILDFKKKEIVDFDDLQINHIYGSFRFYDRNTDIMIGDSINDLGLVDGQIRKLLKKGYTEIKTIKKDLAVVKNEDGKMGVVDYSGNVLIPVIHEFVDYSSASDVYLVKDYRKGQVAPKQ